MEVTQYRLCTMCNLVRAPWPFTVYHYDMSEKELEHCMVTSLCIYMHVTVRGLPISGFMGSTDADYICIKIY